MSSCGDLRAGVVGAQDLLQRALEVAADLAVGVQRRPRRRPARRPGSARRDHRRPRCRWRSRSRRRSAAHSASTRVRTSRRVVFIATHRRRRTRSRRRSADERPTAPHRRHTPRTEGARERKDACSAAIRTAPCAGAGRARRHAPRAGKRCSWTAFGGAWGRKGGYRWEEMCKLVCVVGESGVERRYRTGVEGLLPLLHLGPNSLSRPRHIRSRDAHGLPRHLRLQPRREEPAHDPGQVPGFALGGRGPCQGHRALRAGVDARRLRGLHRQRAAGRPPALRPGAQAPALLQRQLASTPTSTPPGA